MATKTKLATTKTLNTKRKLLTKLIDGELKSKGELTNFCKANTKTAALRNELAELALDYCRTENQRNAEHEDSRRFYTFRNTLNNPQRMGANNTWTVATRAADKDANGNLTQAPAITKLAAGGKGSKVKAFTAESAMANFSTWLESQPIAMLGKLLEHSDTELKGRINSVYERQSNKARAKVGNAQKGKARAKVTAKKKVVAKK